MLTDRGVWFHGRYYPPIAGGAPDGDDPPANLGQTPPAGGQVPPTQDSPPAAGQEPATFSADYVAELRKEAAKNRKAAADAEARLKALDDAKLSETERLTKANAELQAQITASQAQYRDALIRAAVMAEASQQGAVKAETVYRLIDRSGIELADDGTVKGAEKAVKALLEAEPYLKASGTNGSAGPNPTPRNSGPPSRDEMVNDLYERMRQGAFPRL